MNRLATTFAATTLAAGIVAGYLWQQLRTERAHNLELQSRLVQASAPRLSAPSLAPADAPVPDAGAAQGAGPDTTSAGPARDGNARRARAFAAGIRDILNDPQNREMVDARLREMLPRMFPDLAQELGLSEEELGKLHDLLARQQVNGASNLLNLNADGAGDPAALRDAAEGLRQANEAEIAALLGGKYPRWQEYQESLPARQQVNQLRTRLASGGNPLSDAQSRSMIAALATEQKRLGQSPAAQDAMGAMTDPRQMQRGIDQRIESNRRLRDIAERQLTQPQMESFNRMLEQEERLIRALSQAGARRGPPGGEQP